MICQRNIGLTFHNLQEQRLSGSGMVSHFRNGSRPCENAKAINRDRTNYSFKTVSCAHIASAFNFEIEIKNIVLVALRTFEFSHSLGQSRHSDHGPAPSSLPRSTDIVRPPRHFGLVPKAVIPSYAIIEQKAPAMRRLKRRIPLSRFLALNTRAMTHSGVPR
jgi:hypothetical protein